MNIITLTLNPAFDLHCKMNTFEPERENRAEVTSLDAGGKGINVSRALNAGGVKNVAVAVVGDENADGFARALKKEGIDLRQIRTPGRIRENITLHPLSAPETRISFDGFYCDGKILKEVESTVNALADNNSIVTFTGSNPCGLDISEVKAFIKRLKAKGVKIVIDSGSFSLDDICECAPWLIKPNGEEISRYLNKEVSGFEDVKEAAADLFKKGVENVMVSLGKKGAMLVCKEGAFVANAPSVNAVSTVGAGDSSIAGFICAFSRGDKKEDCLKNAVAFGSAACLEAGTRAPDIKNINRFLDQITIKSI